MTIIVLSGTPTTGKTTIAGLLASRLGASIICISSFVTERALLGAWDPHMETHEVDEDTCRDALIDEINTIKTSRPGGPVIVEGVIADIVADLGTTVIVLRLHPVELEARLAARRYPPRKVAENVQAEILGTCTSHVRENRGNNFFDIDTTGKTPGEITAIIEDLVAGTKHTDPARYRPGLVDWIQDEAFHRYFDDAGTGERENGKGEKKILKS